MKTSTVNDNVTSSAKTAFPIATTIAATFAVTFAILFTAAFSGCASTGSATPKSREGEVRLTAKMTANGTLTPEFIVKLNPESRTFFLGSVVPAGSDSYVMTVDQMHWFSNWHDGWTEADITTTGSLLLEKNGNGWDVTVLSKLVPEQTTAAKVRYRDAIKRNEQAVSLMNRRIERITATAEWLAGKLPVENFSGSDGMKAFKKEAGSLLFPELYGYPAGKAKSADTKENRNRGEGYGWDVAYTKETFPEYMVDIRNTGTLFRDWEESTELIYFMYLQTK